MRWPLAILLAIAVTAQAQVQQAFSVSAKYAIIDLSGGSNASKYPVSYTSDPPDLDFNTCRTKELWLRLVPAGTFMMGSPADELGRQRNEDQRRVTLTQPFYIGVFPVTQRQYELVMGTNPSQHKHDNSGVPVERVSYDMIRGSGLGARWPASNGVDATSFLGRLRSKTGLPVDLPTEAQWEYACRAGTATALNSGKNLTSATQCPNMAEVGRYLHNHGDGKGGHGGGTTDVGAYQPNAWGLYDMHGNVLEWCLDWFVESLGTAPATDPKGASSGSRRAMRGGGSDNDVDASRCRSAMRASYLNSNALHHNVGFRIVILPKPGQVKPALAMGGELGAAEEKLAETCAEFKAIWDVYKASAEKINDELQPKFDAVLQQYRKSLETLKGTAQSRGDLPKTKTIVAEIERFGEMNTLPSAPDEETISEIKTLQANTIRPFTTLEKDKLSRMTALTKRYGLALEQLLSDLTKAGKLDDATAVSEARERAKRLVE